MTRQRISLLLIGFALFVSACSSQATIVTDVASDIIQVTEVPEIMATDPIIEMPEATTDDIDAMEAEDMGTETDDEMMDEDVDMEETMPIFPDWYSITLRDVNSGETFQITDYQGKVVLVETMAMWCSVCLQQQIHVRTLHERLKMEEDFVSVALDIDPNEDAGPLRNYARNNGFDWLYAISPVEVSRELAELYGDLFLNPPSAPMLIIDKQGEAHPLPFGLKSLENLQAAVESFLNE
jgi:hypothetical protein